MAGMQDAIRTELKSAMLAREDVRVMVLRDLIAKFTNELVAKGRKPTEAVTDDEAMTVIKRAVKQRKDSIEQFRAGGRADLVASEEAELRELEKFLPAQMSREELAALVARVAKANPPVTGGRLMGLVMKETHGQADGADVKAVVDALLTNSTNEKPGYSSRVKSSGPGPVLASLIIECSTGATIAPLIFT